MEELIEQIECVDPDGDHVTVYVYQDIIPAGHNKDPNATIKGMKRAQLSNGQPGNYRGPDSFETLDRVRLVRR